MMLAYSILMFVIAALFLVFGILIQKGNTKLIHDYHQTRVKEEDKREYGKAFAKAMYSIVLTLVLSGVVALFGETKTIVAASTIILLVGLIASFVLIVKVQKKYNGGMF